VTYFVSNAAGESNAAQESTGDWTRTARKRGKAADRVRIIAFSPSHPPCLPNNHVISWWWDTAFRIGVALPESDNVVGVFEKYEFVISSPVE